MPFREMVLYYGSGQAASEIGVKGYKCIKQYRLRQFTGDVKWNKVPKTSYITDIMKKSKDSIDCRKYNKILNWAVDKVGPAQKISKQKNITYIDAEKIKTKGMPGPGVYEIGKAKDFVLPRRIGMPKR